MSIHGEYRLDGSWIGYDYDRQMCIDTNSDAERDHDRALGSACNPLLLSRLSVHDMLAAEHQATPFI